MLADTDCIYIRRAIALAMRGRGSVEPNPMVGCVIVRDGTVLGEGFHVRRGGLHAEPAALATCTESVVGATAYITLEPCCHTNKLTPPCAPILIKAKIARVVIGCFDANPAVNGNGVAMLRQAGITVDAPVLEAECKQLIAPFLQQLAGQGPYLTLKWAESSNGKVAGSAGRRVQISGPEAARAIHQLRTRCDGIAIGIQTALIDDPLLSARNVPLLRLPHRFVLDSRLMLPITSQLVRTARQQPLTLFTLQGNEAAGNEKAGNEKGTQLVLNTENETGTQLVLNREILATSPFHSPPNSSADYRTRYNTLIEHGVNIVEIPPAPNAPPTHLDLPKIRHHWSALGFTHILIEPGPKLAATWLSSADRLWQVRSPHPIDATAPTAPPPPPSYSPTASIPLGVDVLTEYLNTQSPWFFANVSSADVEMARKEMMNDECRMRNEET